MIDSAPEFVDIDSIELIDPGLEAPEDSAEEGERRAKMRTAFEQVADSGLLNDAELIAVMARAHPGKKITYNQVGEMIGTSGSAAREAEKRGLTRIAAKLDPRDFLEGPSLERYLSYHPSRRQ